MICATCGHDLPTTASSPTGYRLSCKACIRATRERTIRRSVLRRQRRHREAVALARAEAEAWALREAEIAAQAASTVRAVIEYGRDDRCIVWEPGPQAFCAYVTPASCPCGTFAEHGDCVHARKAAELLERVAA